MKTDKQIYVTFRRVINGGLELSTPIAIACDETNVNTIAYEASNYVAVKYVYIKRKGRLRKNTLLLNEQTFKDYLEKNAKDIN